MKPTILCYGCMQDSGTISVCPHCGWEKGTQAQLTQHLPPGSILNQRYLIGRVLGQGGFGVTYIAWDEVLNLRLAIKEYLPNGIATRNYGNPDVTLYPSEDLKEQYAYGLSRFIEEARALARFSNHPNIVTVRDYFEANNTAYLVMDYIEGITYKEYLKRRGNKISIEETMGVIAPIMNALEKIHSAGLVHRDISPDNIYITNDNEVVLLDFGAARYALGDKSKSFSVILKAGYAPEEQYRSRGIQGPFTDVYALGATIYRSITGLVPPEALDRTHDDIVELPSHYGVSDTGNVEAIIIKALAIFAKDRYQTVEELRSALATAVPNVQTPEISKLDIINRLTAEKSVPIISSDPKLQDVNVGLEQTLPIKDPVSDTALGQQETVKATSNPQLSEIDDITKPMKRTLPIPPQTSVMNPFSHPPSRIRMNNSRAKDVARVFTLIAILMVVGVIIAIKMSNTIGSQTTSSSYPSQTTSTSASTTNAEGGQQVITYPSGDRYDGILQNGKRNGQGTMTYADGSTYSGGWVDDMKSGQGTLTNTKGTYTGAWANDKRNGQGIATYSLDYLGGGKYDGNWKDDSKQGQGTFYFVDGTKYVGQWKDGARNGQGILYNANGTQAYSGEWANDKPLDEQSALLAQAELDYNLLDSSPHFAEGRFSIVSITDNQADVSICYKDNDPGRGYIHTLNHYYYQRQGPGIWVLTGTSNPTGLYR